VDIKVSANVVTFYTYSPLSTRAGSICNSSKSDGLSLQHKLRKRPSFSLRGFEGLTPPGKNTAGWFYTPNFTPPADRADPELPLYLGRDERLMCRREDMVPYLGFHMVPLPTWGSLWFHSPPRESFPTGGDRSTPHRGSFSPPGKVIALPTWGVFPHRRGSFHSALGESASPQGEIIQLPHMGSLSPYGETVPLPTGGVAPRRRGAFHSLPGESPPTGGNHYTPHRGSFPTSEIITFPNRGVLPHRVR
jgi:hypothetical protein